MSGLNVLLDVIGAYRSRVVVKIVDTRHQEWMA
jgi:hypothetical protein